MIKMTKKELIAENKKLKILLNDTRHLLEDREKAHEKCVEIIKDKPGEGKTYLLVGGSDKPSISNGNTWAESEIKGGLK